MARRGGGQDGQRLPAQGDSRQRHVVNVRARVAEEGRRHGVRLGGAIIELERGRGRGVAIDETVGESGGGDLGWERVSESSPPPSASSLADKEALVGEGARGVAARRGVQTSAPLGVLGDGDVGED